MEKLKSLTIQHFALYLGSDCIVHGKTGKLTKADTEHLPCVNFPRGNGVHDRQFVQSDQIQLLLTPLSQVKLEHIKAIATKHEYDEKYMYSLLKIVS